MLLGALEAGGTKMVCAIVEDTGKVLDRYVLPNTLQEEVIPKMVDYFRGNKIQALGIGSFGPLDLNKNSENYGTITRTPKPGWDYVNFYKTFKDELGISVAIDTDVNVAVYGEVCLGTAKALESAIYITIGTGIGVGVYINGGLLHGLCHPEAGHIKLPRHPEDNYEGCCRFHKDCFEGMASGPALEKRWGKPGRELYDNLKVWELEAHYISEALFSYILTYAPQRIILGGGVMHKPDLLHLVRENVVRLIDGYVDFAPETIVVPALGDNVGVVGAALLGKTLLCKTDLQF